MSDGNSADLPGMQPDDLYRIRWLSDARISPDGQRVAFVHTTLDEAEDDYRAQIWFAEASIDAVRPLTRGPRRDGAPRWSPDGRWLAFTSRRGD
ncbi:MAG TPA: hypothetical protein VH916_00835, partial [Dehalococcoidia bacterium]